MAQLERLQTDAIDENLRQLPRLRP
jgi:hypothetical protein